MSSATTEGKVVELQERFPTVDEYLYLRESVGWRTPDRSLVSKALKNSLFAICAVRQDEIVGMARFVGDDAIYYYLQDVIVAPKSQRMGVGSALVRRSVEWLSRSAPASSLVMLTCNPELKSFYDRMGFRQTSDIIMQTVDSLAAQRAAEAEG